jgi:hypothetical protein
MKTKTSTIIAATVAAALASVASAQISYNPTGVNLFNNASVNNAGYYQTAFGGAAGLYVDSGDNTAIPIVATWNSSPVTPAVFGSLFSAGGGSVKSIFLGETAGNQNDFGYVKFPNSGINVEANLNWLATDIENSINGPGNITSGQEAYVHYNAGETVDFFLYNSGIPHNDQGLGAWFVLGQGGLESYLHNGAVANYAHYRWTIQSVTTEYIDTNGNLVTGAVDTLLVSFEDFTVQQNPNQNNPIEIPNADYSDFIFAFQFLPNQAVPEPSTYGLMGAAALLGLVGYRRFKASKKAA